MTTIRENLEKWEEEYLSPYATLSKNSLGRLRDEEPCDIRPVFQRDRDRILHCKAFRRLKDKTQVFLAPEGDHYRTRLTHTLEVSQNARTIAKALRLNEDLAEAIALGHDLGHTPFGHAGERALDRVCPYGFEHSEQSVRTVDVLEKDGARLAADLVQSLGKFYDATGSLRYLSLPRDSITIDGVNYTKDISRIYIDCTKSSYTGCATKKFLRRKYGIEVENATVDGITLIASIGDDAQAFDRLTQAVIAADRTFFTLPRRKPVPLPPAGKAVPLPSDAEYRAEMYPFAVGKVSAENVCVYPPGIPLVLRGEIITDEIVKFLSSAERNGVQVLTDFGNPAGFVSIAEDDETE